MDLKKLVEIANIALEREWSTLRECLGFSEDELVEIDLELSKFGNNQPLKLTTVLDDSCENKDLNVDVWFGAPNNLIALQPEGYEDMSGGEPIVLDWFDGVCSVKIWDQTQEDPVHSIVLEPVQLEEDDEAGPCEWDVPVCRVAYQHNTIRVVARTEEEAIQQVQDKAGSYSYTEKHAEYLCEEGAFEVEDGKE
jgi:hypothetical protein